MTTQPMLPDTELKPPSPVKPPMDPDWPWAPAPSPLPDVPKHQVVGNDDWMTIDARLEPSTVFHDEPTYIDGPLGPARYVEEDVQQHRWNQWELREHQTLEAPAPQVAPPTPGFEIEGGVGGTAAYLEDLSAVVDRLDRAAPCVQQIDRQFNAVLWAFGDWARRISRSLQDSITPWTAPPLYAGAMQIVTEVELAGTCAKNAAWDGGTKAVVTKRDLNELARSVEGARTLYQESDSLADSLLEASSFLARLQTDTLNFVSGPFQLGSVIAMGGTVVTAGGAVALDWGAGKAGLDLGAADALSPVHEFLIADLAHSLSQLHPLPMRPGGSRDSDVEQVSYDLTTVAQALNGDYIREGTAELVTTPSTLHPVHNAQDAVGGVESLYRLDELDPGSVGVQKNTLPSGETTWVVMVPGTQGGVTEDHGFDWFSNVLLMAGKPNPATQTVQHAMRQSGIKPDEKVMMVGHSQGGMSSIDISNSQEFNVTHVVTVGTPTALQASNHSTKYLAVEAEKDLVPPLDGSKNSDRSNRITVRADGDRLETPAGLEDDNPHAIENYRELLKEVGRTGNPSTETYFQSVQDEIFEKPVPTSQGQYRSVPELLTFQGKATAVD